MGVFFFGSRPLINYYLLVVYGQIIERNKREIRVKEVLKYPTAKASHFIRRNHQNGSDRPRRINLSCDYQLDYVSSCMNPVKHQNTKKCMKDTRPRQGLFSCLDVLLISFAKKMLSSTWHKHLRERWKSTFSQVCTSCDLVISPCVIANDENYISSSGMANPVRLTLFMNMVNPFARQDDEA